MEPRVELLFWTALSLGCGLLVVPGLLRSALGANLTLKEVLRFAWMAGIPFIALVRGAVGPDMMGLGRDISQSDHLLGFTRAAWLDGAGAGAAVCAIVLFVLWLGGKSAGKSAWPGIGPRALRDALYNEAHWMFYRAAPAIWLGDALGAAGIGFALMALEWLAHPGFAKMQKILAGRQRLAVMFACAVASAFLYLSTSNLWLMMAVNLVIQIVGSRVLVGGNWALSKGKS
ncbi:MAG: hypothetical protein WAU96_02230 [Anaerolineae bacterium]